MAEINLKDFVSLRNSEPMTPSVETSIKKKTRKSKPKGFKYQSVMDELKVINPEITVSTSKTYGSLLNTLYLSLNPLETQLTSIESIKNNSKKYLDYIENTYKDDIVRMKALLNPLLLVSKENVLVSNRIRDILKDIREKLQNETILQKKTETQEENWVNKDIIEELLNKLEKQIKPLHNIKKLKSEKKTISKEQMKTYRNYIILVLFSGKYIEPRRSLDYTEMKFRNYDVDKDNYITNIDKLKLKTEKKFVFNVYKTAKTYGKQEITPSKELVSILKKYIQALEFVYPNNDYLLTDTSGNKMINVQITQALNEIFGKNTSVNILRHVYLSDYHKNTPKLQEMNKLANNMGHSIETQLAYVKSI